MQTISLESLILKRHSNVEQAHRPLTGHTAHGARELIVNSIEGDGNGRRDTNERTVASLAPKLLRLATPDIIVSIPNGWEESRFSFVLVCFAKDIHSGVERKYMVSGYTDTDEITRGGMLPEDTIFYINGVKTFIVENHRNSRPRNRVVSSDEFLHSSDGDDYSLSINRPVDTMRRSSDELAHFHEGDDDVGIINKVNYLSCNDTKVSETNHRSPTNYLNAILTSTRQSQSGSRRNDSGDLQMRPPHDFARDAMFSTDSFIRAINQKSESQLTTGSFRAEWLDDIDPGLLRDRTEVYTKFNRMESQDHFSSDLEGDVASAINIFTSSIAASFGIDTIAFVVGNMGRTGGMTLKILAGTATIGGASGVNDIMEDFRDEFLLSAAPFISRNGEIHFDGRVDYRALIDSSVEVTLDERAYCVPYIFSTVADGLSSPIISPREKDDHSGSSSVTSALASLTTYVQDAYSEMNTSSGMLEANDRDARARHRSSYLPEPSYDDDYDLEDSYDDDRYNLDDDDREDRDDYYDREDGRDYDNRYTKDDHNEYCDY